MTDTEQMERPAASTLEKVLRANKFAVTAEIVPPRVPGLKSVTTKIGILDGQVDAINITDMASAAVKMSSLAISAYLLQQGAEPVMQVTSRDRNRLALQADLVGGYALGLRNVFAVTGDHVSMGDHPQAKPVYDMDSVQVIQMFDGIRKGRFDSGLEVRSTPKLPVHYPNFFLGGAANPYADPVPLHVLKTRKKRDAGADFIQSQCTFDVDRFRDYMKLYVDDGLHEELYFLVGVMPVKSHRPLAFMAEDVPGMRIPDAAMKRMKDAEDGEEEGISMAVEIINEVRGVEGVSGIHLMTNGWEAIIPEILKRAGLTPEEREVVEIHNPTDEEPQS